MFENLSACPYLMKLHVDVGVIFAFCRINLFQTVMWKVQVSHVSFWHWVNTSVSRSKSLHFSINKVSQAKAENVKDNM